MATTASISDFDRQTIAALAELANRVHSCQAALVKQYEAGLSLESEGGQYGARVRGLNEAMARYEGALDIASRTGLLSRAGEGVAQKVRRGEVPVAEDYEA